MAPGEGVHPYGENCRPNPCARNCAIGPRSTLLLPSYVVLFTTAPTAHAQLTCLQNVALVDTSVKWL